jgi:di/tricarboxylate transporter
MGGFTPDFIFMNFNLGEITLAALILAVILSCFTRLNIGMLAIAMAWLIGVYLGGMPLRDISSGFPVDLFLTLVGVSLLFSQAHVNGTLEKVAHEAVRFCRGRVGLVPILYFFLGATLASAGPGNIATTGLLAPIAMSAALRMNISPFLMAIMVGNGANSGSLSRLGCLECNYEPGSTTFSPMRLSLSPDICCLAVGNSFNEPTGLRSRSKHRNRSTATRWQRWQSLRFYLSA